MQNLVSFNLSALDLTDADTAIATAATRVRPMIAQGSDIMGVALEGYGLLKLSSKGEALKSAPRPVGPLRQDRPRGGRTGTGGMTPN